MTESGRASECLDEDLVLAFAQGDLSEGPRALAEEHLDVCETCQRVVSEAARGLARTVAEGAPAPRNLPWNTTFKPDALVGGRYVVKRFIARGGMGEVYEAFDSELSQRVALKTVTSTAGDNSLAVQRLKAEVQLARRVSHPNVCRIYDLGRHVTSGGEPIHFLTMEFVEGETLGQRVRSAGALSMSEARKVARELLLGLRAAHESGVLHRDFKSDNVMLSADAEGKSLAVVLDFGLARAVGHDPTARGSSSSLVGTVGYIAPEQLEGAPHTPASDLYSLGVVWFQMLTGQLPFDAPPSPAPSRKVPARRVRAPSSINPQVPVELDLLVERCLAREPELRFQSARDVLDALDRLEEARPSAGSRRMRAMLPPLLAFGIILAFAAYLLSRPYAETLQPTVTSPRQRAVHPSERGVLRSTRAPETAPAVAELPAAATPRAADPPWTGMAPQRSAPAAHETTTRQATRDAPVREPSRLRGIPKRTAEAPAPADMPEPARSASPRPSVVPARPRPDWENPFDAPDPPEVVGTAREPN